MDKALFDLVPSEARERVLAEAEAWQPVADADDMPTEEPAEGPQGRVVVRVTSFEGAKGLSAQHVVIAGLHNGEIPHDPANIQDIEICRFVVGLTRTRKHCYLVHTWRFAQNPKRPSIFLSWIKNERYERVRVNAEYWSERGN